MDVDLLERELTRDEGRSLSLYKDSKGIWSIGIGRNIQEQGITDGECALMFRNDIAKHLALLTKYCPWWARLDEVRQRVLANMAFNLGVGPCEEDPKGKLLTFTSTLDLIQRQQFEAAANHMQTSLWASQVGARATRLIEAMRTGKMPT